MCSQSGSTGLDETNDLGVRHWVLFAVVWLLIGSMGGQR
jgi:hypothetical protein